MSNNISFTCNFSTIKSLDVQGKIIRDPASFAKLLIIFGFERRNKDLTYKRLFVFFIFH